MQLKKLVVLGIIFATATFGFRAASAAPPSAAQVPFQVQIAGDCGPLSYSVPNDRQAVIENVSAVAQTPGSATNFLWALTTTAGGVSANHAFAPSQTATGTWVVSAQTRLYADPGTSVALGAFFIGEGTFTCQFVSISGFLQKP